MLLTSEQRKEVEVWLKDNKIKVSYIDDLCRYIERLLEEHQGELRDILNNNKYDIMLHNNLFRYTHSFTNLVDILCYAKTSKKEFNQNDQIAIVFDSNNAIFIDRESMSIIYNRISESLKDNKAKLLHAIRKFVDDNKKLLALWIDNEVLEDNA